MKTVLLALAIVAAGAVAFAVPDYEGGPSRLPDPRPYPGRSPNKPRPVVVVHPPYYPPPPYYYRPYYAPRPYYPPPRPYYPPPRYGFYFSW